MDQAFNDIIGKYSTYIRQIYPISPSQKHIEIEARLTEFSQKRGVSLRTFNFLNEVYRKYPTIKEITLDKIYGKFRLTTHKNGQPFGRIIEKKSIWNIKELSKLINEYNIKIDMNIEEISQGPVTGNPTVIRNKNRSSYMISDYIRLDLTMVNMTDERKREVINYEVELELLDVKYLDDWVGELYILIKNLQNTEFIYTFEEYNKLNEHIISQLSAGVRGVGSEPPRSLLMQARNLEYHHLVYDNIIGGNIRYRVTVKTDGVRKLFVYYNKSFYLVMLPGEVNKVYQRSVDPYGGKLDYMISEGELIPKEKRKSDKNGTIDTKYYYMIFDMLSIKTNSLNDIKLLSHSDRMKYAETCKIIIKNESGNNNDIVFDDSFTLSTKKFIDINNSAPEFFMTMNELDIMTRQVPYENDGFIFVPDNQSYNPRAKLAVLKWKPASRLTIDLAISKKISADGKTTVIKTYSYQHNKEFLTYDLSSNTVKGRGYSNTSQYSEVKLAFLSDILYWPTMVNLPTSKDLPLINSNYEFKFDNNKFSISKTTSQSDNEGIIFSIWNRPVSGSTFVASVKFEKYPNGAIVMNIFSSGSYVLFDKPVYTIMDDGLTDILNFPPLTVIEFMWDGIQLVPLLIRRDKTLPNEDWVVRDIWNLILDPIELSTLLGNDIRLMRKYHNRIKRRLYSGNVVGILKKSGNLLDLGSGIGGDVSKWKGYNKIICVEPNGDYLPELTLRIKQQFGINPEIISNESQIGGIGINNKVLILNTGAENTGFIKRVTDKFFGGPADIISSMLSLSFFWFNNTLLNSLVSTINLNLKSGGLYIYMTIDGDLVQQYFDPVMKGPIITSVSLLGGDINLKYLKDESKLFIDLPKSETVRNQTESLVFLDALRYSLNNFRELSWYRADQEILLNSGERALSSMYSYGGFIKN